MEPAASLALQETRRVDSLEALRARRREILRLAALRGAENVRVLGSFARNDVRADSDVDLLIDVLPGHGLLDLGGLLVDLQELLGREVELVTEPGIRTESREKVLSSAVPL